MAGKAKPLQKNHLRLALRDPRLKPKAKPKTYVWPRPKRKRFLTEEEAGRFFSATMRTRNRALRDLLPDREQLKRYGLPRWETEEELAKGLNISLNELRFYAIHRQA